MVTRNHPEDGNGFHVFITQSAPESRRVHGITVLEPETDTDGTADHSRRQHDRVPGPFDGVRMGLLETPIRIYDLSLGGCFVHSMHEQREGSSVQLRIDLADEGWIVVDAETLYRRTGFGFAVRFIDLDIATEARLMRTIDRLKKRQSFNP